MGPQLWQTKTGGFPRNILTSEESKNSNRELEEVLIYFGIFSKETYCHFQENPLRWGKILAPLDQEGNMSNTSQEADKKENK